MTTRRRLTLLSLLLLLSPAFSSRVAATVRHLTLVRSEPAKDSSVSSPEAVKLWFSEAPELKVTKVTVMGADGKKARIGAVKGVKGDVKQVVVPLEAAAAPGAYTVSWRTMSKDGHVVSGEFGFRVKPD